MRVALVSLALLLAACQSGAAIGAACVRNAECGSPLVCRFGRCRSECAAQRDCPIGTSCLRDASGAGSCALLDDPDCSAAGQSCQAPLACVGRECVNVCSVGPECPAGSACVPVGDGRARCVRTDGVDASLPDAGAVDAPRSDSGICSPAATCDTAIELALGDGFTCVRAQSGRIWCWGVGSSIARDHDVTGCTMTGTDQYACPIPAPLLAQDDTGAIGPTRDIAQIDAQDSVGCFVTRSGAMSCWGTSIDAAPLGRNDVMTGERARTVMRVGGGSLTGVDYFFLFGGSVIAVGLDTMPPTPPPWFGWGSDAGDVLALGTVTATPIAQSITPVAVDGHSVVTGETHACGITSAGGVVCWGSNDLGESDPDHPGAGATAGPTPIAGVTNATQLVLGRTHSCALAAEGFVCWGGRQRLWIDGDFATCHTTDTVCHPTVMPTGSLVVAHVWPARNTDDFCASDAANQLYCWGESYGIFGHLPTRVPGLPPIGSAVIGWTHACAITTDSDVWCWGLNDSGQLGRLPLAASGQQGPEMVQWP